VQVRHQHALQHVKLLMAPPFTAMPTELEMSARVVVPMVVLMVLVVEASKSDVINGGVSPVPPAEARAEQQGLTLVHHSAQLEPCLDTREHPTHPEHPLSPA